MTPNKLIPIFALIFLISISFVDAIVVNVNHVTIYPGQEGKVTLEVENNENSDIEEVSVSIDLENLPFTSVGSSEKDLGDIDEEDEERVSFDIKASTDIEPGDYNIPYTISYFNVEKDEEFEKTGSFGIRVSAKTELDFAVEIQDSAIINQKGQISLEIINQGLGEIKSVSVQIFPQGFELLSKDKIFVGTIDSDDTDIASFDVIYTSTNGVLSAKITYKDFDNKEQTEIVNLPFKIYTVEEAKQRGLIKNNSTWIYFLIVVILIVAWMVYRRIRKVRRNKKLKG